MTKQGEPHLANLADDSCGRCGCSRKYHNPPPITENASQWAHRIGAVNVTVDIPARTCCWDCPFCICFCIAFVEPFTGQPYPKCFYDGRNYVPSERTESSQPDRPIQKSGNEDKRKPPKRKGTPHPSKPKQRPTLFG